MAGQDAYTFRRSRTLTGSASSEVRSAAENSGTDLKSSRVQLHELKRHRRGVTGALLLSLLIVVGIAWMLGQFIRLPAEVAYARDSELRQQPPSSSYLATIDTYFAAHPLEHFYFRLDEANLARYVASKHPEVRFTDIESQLPGFYKVKVELKKPLLSWSSGSTKVYVDQRGTSFSANFYEPPKITVDDQSGIKLVEGADILTSNRFVSFIGQVLGKIEESSDIEVKKVIIPRGVTRQVQLVIEGGEYPIKMSIDRNPAAQAGDIINAVGYVNQKNIKPEYLDVRVAGKAYYR